MSAAKSQNAKRPGVARLGTKSTKPAGSIESTGTEAVASKPTLEEMLEAVARVPRWEHRYEVAPGVVTPGRVDVAAQLPRMGLPDDMTGMRVLDIGCWDGAYSVECLRRGARWVEGWEVWMGDDSLGLGYSVMRQCSGYDDEQMWVHNKCVMAAEINSPGVGVHDLVLLLGVIYHLDDPVRGIAVAAGQLAPGGLLVVETHTSMLEIETPCAEYYPAGELYGDSTNKWGPNPAAVLAWMRMAGLVDVAQVHGIRASDRLGRHVFHGRAPARVM